MLIYLDVNHTADVQDKMELYKNIKPLTSEHCAGYGIHSALKNPKNSFTHSADSNYTSQMTVTLQPIL